MRSVVFGLLFGLGLCGCGGSQPPSCSGSGAACTDSSNCCTAAALGGAVDLVCSASRHACAAAVLLPLGETCRSGGQCTSAYCDGHHFCTKVCFADSECPAGTACTPNQGTYKCEPRCTQKTDCLAYGVIDPSVSGQTLACQTRTTHDGATAKVCAY